MTINNDPRVVQFPGDTTPNMDKYVGPQRQVTVDVNRNELRLHDGKKAGGWRFPNLRQLQQMFMSNKSEFGKVAFTQDAKGFLARVSDQTWQVRQLLAANGMTWANPYGDTGDPKISLPNRLKESTPYISDGIDTVIETGFYFVAKNTVGLPSDIISDDTILIVIGYNDTVTPFSLITQIALDALQPSGALYIRRRINNVWAPWSNLSGSKGILSDLLDGVDQQLRSWSAFDLSAFIRYQVQSIQYVESTNIAKQYSYNQLFTQTGAGADTQTVTTGPHTTATGDRFELLGSATAPDGQTRTAKVEVEVNSSFQLVASQIITSTAGSGPATDNVIGRVVRTATGFDITDGAWATLSSVNGTVSGNFRLTTGAADKAGAKLSRWRVI